MALEPLDFSQPSNRLSKIAEQQRSILFPRNDLDHYSQSRLKHAVFKVTADIQNDIYHLFAYDGYVNIAYIVSRDSSRLMNNLFRNIRENTNVDLGEESEDEDIFQNVNLDKYVDLKKEYKMQCEYHPKFKKWMPMKVVGENTRLVAMKDLLHRPSGNNQKPSGHNHKPSVYKTNVNKYKR